MLDREGGQALTIPSKMRLLLSTQGFRSSLPWVTKGSVCICKPLELPVDPQTSSCCCEATGEHWAVRAWLSLLLHNWICRTEGDY